MSTSPQTIAEPRISFDAQSRVQALIIAACFGGVFYNVFLDMSYTWVHDSNWSHGWMIPLFSAWLVYHNWSRIRATPIRAAWLGMPVMLGGLALYQYALFGIQIGYVRPFSMLICLLGVIILLCGVPAMRYLWVPWMYLFFAVPLPKGMYFAMTDPLRRLAASAATGLLGMAPALEIERKGSMIEYLYRGQFGVIGVEDACSGMRSTITLCALGVAVAFMSARPWWQRLIMIASCVPIATLANVLRVIITCGLMIFVDDKYATGTYHTVLGLVLLLLAFGLFSLLGWVLNNLFVEEDEADNTAANSGQGAAYSS